jgi:hypothetical protein
MNEQRRNQRKDVQWQPITSELNSVLSIISFHNLVRTDHLARIIDRSIIGIGIETDHPITPGVVWFKESVYGSQCGILMWCHQTGTLYRCGIRFVSLTRSEEEFLRYQVQQTEHCAHILDPDRIIARLNDCMLKS